MRPVSTAEKKATQIPVRWRCRKDSAKFAFEPRIDSVLSRDDVARWRGAARVPRHRGPTRAGKASEAKLAVAEASRPGGGGEGGGGAVVAFDRLVLDVAVAQAIERLSIWLKARIYVAQL